MNQAIAMLVVTFTNLVPCGHAGSPHTSAFRDLVCGSTKVQLRGWALVRGELILFSTPEAMERHSKFPNCVSGVLPNMRDIARVAYDRKEVEVVGTPVEFNSLPDDPINDDIQKSVAGTPIVNWCFGSKVLLLDSIRLVGQNKSTDPGKPPSHLWKKP